VTELRRHAIRHIDDAPRVHRAVLRLRQRHAPPPGIDVSDRRAVHPLLRRRRAGLAQFVHDIMVASYE